MSAYFIIFLRKISALIEKKGPNFSSLFVICTASTLKGAIYWITARWITQKIPLGRDTSRLAYHFSITFSVFHRMRLSHHVAQNGCKSMLTAVCPVHFCSNYWFTTLERARMFDSSRLNLILDFTGYLRCCTNHLLSLHFSVLVCDGEVDVTSGLQGGEDGMRFCLQRVQCCASCVGKRDKMKNGCLESVSLFSGHLFFYIYIFLTCLISNQLFICLLVRFLHSNPSSPSLLSPHPIPHLVFRESKPSLGSQLSLPHHTLF